jgi:hypothetical protein
MKTQYLFYTVRYGSVGHKWEFHWPGGRTLLVACKGRAMADKVAHIVAGALKRNSNELDGLARTAITKLVNTPAE